MPRSRGGQKLMAISLCEPNEPAIRASQTTSPLTKIIALWTPRQFLTSTGIGVKGLLSDVNSKVEQQGIHPMGWTDFDHSNIWNRML
jgi:hypothetical protein